MVELRQREYGDFMLKKMLRKLDEQFSLYAIAKIIGVLFIVLLLLQTETVWGSWISKLMTILRPFIFGFAIAYVMNPLVQFLKDKGLNKNISIIIIWVGLIVLITILIFMLTPTLYAKLGEFFTSIIDGVKWISVKIKETANLKDFSLINSLTDNIINMIQNYDNWLPGITSTLPSLMTSLLDIVTNTLFTIIIAIYMLFDFERIKGYVRRAISVFIPNCHVYLHEIDTNVTIYLKSMVLLIGIRLIEYCAFYFIVGHNDWLILGIISAIGAVIPYVGGITANAVAILTGLTLAPLNLALMLLGIVILSNVDNYIISPMVHEKRSALGPLITLVAVFGGGVLSGMEGVMISLPLVIAIKTSVDVYKEANPNKLSELEMEFKDGE